MVIIKLACGVQLGGAPNGCTGRAPSAGGGSQGLRFGLGSGGDQRSRHGVGSRGPQVSCCIGGAILNLLLVFDPQEDRGSASTAVCWGGAIPTSNPPLDPIILWEGIII